MEYIQWSEDIEFPYTCDFCTYGCQCDSPYGLDVDERSYPGQEGNCRWCLDGCYCRARTDEEAECTCECECCQCECNCENLYIDADSYNKWIAKTCYVLTSECLNELSLKTSIYKKQCLQSLGNFEFYIRNFPQYHTVIFGGFMGIGGHKYKEHTHLSIRSEEKENKVYFSGPIFVPTLATPNKNPEDATIWMSLTPMEVMSQRSALDFVKDRVLIAGLGMGWLTKKVLESSKSKHVTQIESDSAILDFFGTPLIKQYPNKLDLVLSDIWKFLEQTNLKNFDTILFDIWPLLTDSKHDTKFKQLRRKHPNVWGWGYED